MFHRFLSLFLLGILRIPFLSGFLCFLFAPFLYDRLFVKHCTAPFRSRFRTQKNDGQLPPPSSLFSIPFVCRLPYYHSRSNHIAISATAASNAHCAKTILLWQVNTNGSLLSNPLISIGLIASPSLASCRLISPLNFSK